MRLENGIVVSLLYEKMREIQVALHLSSNELKISEPNKDIYAGNFKPHSSVRSHFGENFYLSQLFFNSLFLLLSVSRFLSFMRHCLT